MESLSDHVTQHFVKFYENGTFYGEDFDGFGALKRLVPTVRKMIRMDAFISDVNEFRIFESRCDYRNSPAVHREVMSINDDYRCNKLVTCKSCSEKYEKCGCLEFEPSRNEEVSKAT